MFLVCAFFCLPTSVSAQNIDQAKLEEALGRPVQKLGEVYKVGFPRTDLHVTVSGVAIRPGLALGAWAAFAGSDDHATVMGDLVLLEGELGPVMQKLRESGFEITAVHNHLLHETPRVMYMHYMGHGPAAGLAKSLVAALALSKTPLGKPAASAKSPEPAFVKAVEEVIGRKGNLSGGVLAYGIPRANTITMGDMTIAPSEGVAEATNFQEAGPGKVATTGDFVLTSEEVNPVLSALLEHQIAVTALHSHMLGEQPRLFFMHFWGLGGTKAVAEGIRAALGKIKVK